MLLRSFSPVGWWGTERKCVEDSEFATRQMEGRPASLLRQQFWFVGVDISTAVSKDQMGYKLIDLASLYPHPYLARSFIQGTYDILWGQGVLECSPTVWSLLHFCFHFHFTQRPSACLSFAASVSRESSSRPGEWERVSEGGEAAGSWISLKVADNGCNLHLKPRLCTELNTGPLVSWLTRVESAEPCQSIDGQMPPWCAGTFHAKAALQVHLSFNRGGNERFRSVAAQCLLSDHICQMIV